MYSERIQSTSSLDEDLQCAVEIFPSTSKDDIVRQTEKLDLMLNVIKCGLITVTRLLLHFTMINSPTPFS